MKYARPQQPTIFLQRADVEGACPACGESRLKAYPVLSEGGWFNVVKCQNCLTSVSRDPDTTGPVELLSRTI
jgi:uncharacterized Zn finger protein